MKKLLLTLTLATILLLAACSPKTKKMQDNPQELTKETMQENKKEDMNSNDMTKKEDMNSDDMMKKEDMNSDDMMKKEDMHSDDMMSTEKMNEGEMAKEFTLKNLSGESISISDLKGEKVYLKFWASWCPVCLNGLEELNTLANGEQDFKVYSIVAPSMGGEKSTEDFKTWFNTLGYKNIEVLLDENGDVFRTYGVRALPTSTYIGSDGIRVFTAPGHQENDMVISKFKEIK